MNSQLESQMSVTASKDCAKLLSANVTDDAKLSIEVKYALVLCEELSAYAKTKLPNRPYALAVTLDAKPWCAGSFDARAMFDFISTVREAERKNSERLEVILWYSNALRTARRNGSGESDLVEAATRQIFATLIREWDVDLRDHWPEKKDCRLFAIRKSVDLALLPMEWRKWEPTDEQRREIRGDGQETNEDRPGRYKNKNRSQGSGRW